MIYKITPTLYNSYRYYLKAANESAGKGAEKLEEFMATLRGEKFAPTPAILKGYQFEDDIRAYCEGRKTAAGIVKEIGDIVRGGLWQQRLTADIKAFGMDIRLVGVADVIKENAIYDIKRSSSYDLGKYADSLQHLVYLYCSRLPKFRYCVGYGSGVEAAGAAYEDYYLDDNTLPKIRQKCADLLGWLENSNLMQVYKKHWLTAE
jgi:hypothetical protein